MFDMQYRGFLWILFNWASLINCLSQKLDWPLVGKQKVSSLLCYILQIVITTPSLITGCSYQFQWKIGQKYSRATSHWVVWLNFRKSKAKCIVLSISYLSQNIKLFANKLGKLRLFWFFRLFIYKERKNFTNRYPTKPPQKTLYLGY